MDSKFDIAIVGAGAVGGTLAYALARLGFSVVLVEKTALNAVQQPAFDERHLGFSCSTKIALHCLGLWQAMSSQAVAVRRIHVSSQGRFGSVLLDARDEGLESLGYVVPAREVGRVLHRAIAQQDNIRVIAPARLLSVMTAQEMAVIVLDYGGERMEIHADLLVGADGAQSQTRELLRIGATRRAYNQSAVIVNLDTDDPEPGLAYERFIDGGVIALLPRSEAGYAAVFSVANDKAVRLMEMDEKSFAACLQEDFGRRLSHITRVGKRHCFPLTLVRSRELVRERFVLVGNAAHSIHPIAAQGFNLSMRDITALVEVLAKAYAKGRHPGELSVLQQYADWRKWDARLMVAFTDGLTRLFDIPLLPATSLYQKGLVALRYFPQARNLFIRAVTGRLGKQSGLMRGVSPLPDRLP